MPTHTPRLVSPMYMAMCAEDQKLSSVIELLCSHPSQNRANRVKTESAIVTASSQRSVTGRCSAGTKKPLRSSLMLGRSVVVSAMCVDPSVLQADAGHAARAHLQVVPGLGGQFPIGLGVRFLAVAKHADQIRQRGHHRDRG